MARDGDVGSAGNRRAQEFAQRGVACRRFRLRRSAAHRRRGHGAAENQAGRFHGPAKRAGENLSDGNAQFANLGADGACLGAAGIGEVALRRAFLVAGHPLVVLAEVGRRVPEVQDKTSRAQRAQQCASLQLDPRRGRADGLCAGEGNRTGDCRKQREQDEQTGAAKQCHGLVSETPKGGTRDSCRTSSAPSSSPAPATRRAPASGRTTAAAY